MRINSHTVSSRVINFYFEEIRNTQKFFHISFIFIFCVSHIYEKKNKHRHQNIKFKNQLPNSRMIISKLEFSLPHPSYFSRLQYIGAQNIISKERKYINCLYVSSCALSKKIFVKKNNNNRLKYASESHFFRFKAQYTRS